MVVIVGLIYLYHFICLTKVSDTASGPCSNYENLNADNTRSPSHIESVFGNARCDATLTEKWYRIIGDAGTDLTNDSGLIPANGCGTFNQMWMNGPIPEVEDGIVDRQICIKTVFSSCHDSLTIQVKNCCSFRVYYLKSSTGCPHSYCVSDISFDSTGTCTDPTTTTGTTTRETTVDTASTVVTTQTTTPAATATSSSSTTPTTATTSISSTTPTATTATFRSSTTYMATTTGRPQLHQGSQVLVTITKTNNTPAIIFVVVSLVTILTVIVFFAYKFVIKKPVRTDSEIRLHEIPSGMAASPPPTYDTLPSPNHQPEVNGKVYVKGGRYDLALGQSCCEGGAKDHG